jgi:hypothetical protein
MKAPWNDSLEPLDDDTLLPESDALADLPDDLGSDYGEPEFLPEEE